MTRFFKTSTLIVLCLVVVSTAAVAEPCRDSGGADCFILRAQPLNQALLLQAYGLTTLRQIDPADPTLLLVSGPTNVLPEVTESLVKQDPLAIGFEAVTAVDVPEEAAGSLVDATTEVLDTIATTGEYSGSVASYFATSLWSGYLEQPALGQVNVPAMQALQHLESKGEGSVVAIIDTGVDPDHPLLQGALVPGYDFLLDQAGVASEWAALDPATATTTQSDLVAMAEQSYTGILEGNGAAAFVNNSTGAVVEQSYTGILEGMNLPSAFGHGTMVAGIVRLVAPGAQIMPLRVFNGDGTADTSDIIEAIYYAVDNGANVINMSFSTPGPSDELSRAVKHAKSQDVLCITSTGNSGTQSLTYPAAYGEVFGVASVDASNGLSDFSNFGPAITLLAAPGEEVVTSYPGGLYAAAWGTSFAAPFVSGAAATLHNLVPPSIQRIRQREAEGAFEDSSLPPDPNTPATDVGYGVLEALGAFNNGLGTK